MLGCSNLDASIRAYGLLALQPLAKMEWGLCKSGLYYVTFLACSELHARLHSVAS